MSPNPTYARMGAGIVAKEWEDYRTAVYPVSGVTNVQLIETRRAFYAGGWAILNKAATMMSPGATESMADIAVVEALRDELEAFAIGVGLGKA